MLQLILKSDKSWRNSGQRKRKQKAPSRVRIRWGLGSKRTFRNEMSLPPGKTVFVAGEKCQKKSYMSLVQFLTESESLSTDFDAGRYFRRHSAPNFKLLLQKYSLRPCHHYCDYQFVPARFFFQLSFPETLETSKSFLHDSHTSKGRKWMSEKFPESWAPFKTLL